MQDKIIEVLKIVMSVMIFTAALFPMVKWICYHVGALDYPNERKVHKKPMPVMGGLMLYLGFLFGYMLFAPQNTQMLAILIASFIVIMYFGCNKTTKGKRKVSGPSSSSVYYCFLWKNIIK